MRDDFVDFLIRDARVETVGALHDDVVARELLGINIGLHREFFAHAAREDATHVAGGGLVGGEEAHFHLRGGVVVVGGDCV